MTKKKVKKKHFQEIKKPTHCFKCASGDISVELTKDKFWKIKCNDCGLLAWT